MPLNNVWFLSGTATCMYTLPLLSHVTFVGKRLTPPPIHLWLLYITSSSLILARQINFSICPLQMVLSRYFSWLCSPATDLFVTFTCKHTPSKISSDCKLTTIPVLCLTDEYVQLLKIPFPSGCLCRGSLFLPHSQALPWFRVYYQSCLTPRLQCKSKRGGFSVTFLVAKCTNPMCENVHNCLFHLGVWVDLRLLHQRL